jgi:site-specific DNA-adenine methylase
MKNTIQFPENHGGPLHYLGNRFLMLPDVSGHMHPDNSWLNELFTIIQANTNGKKYKRCLEPLSGSASWSLAAMELELAEEYIINDSDRILINTLQLIRDKPDLVKKEYAIQLQGYNSSKSKKNYFVNAIKNYNETHKDEKKSLLLPFIINHSWGGILLHDGDHKIIYRDGPLSEGKKADRYLKEANLTIEMFNEEVDRASMLLNANKVTFTSGDFCNAITDIQPGDFIALNPPYPENERSLENKTGMYIELYTPELLFENIKNLVNKMEANGIDYYMTFGFYNPQFSQFVLVDNIHQPRNYLRQLGYDQCAFGIGLDQMYFTSKFSIPAALQSKVVPAYLLVGDSKPNPDEALRRYETYHPLKS